MDEEELKAVEVGLPPAPPTAPVAGPAYRPANYHAMAGHVGNQALMQPFLDAQARMQQQIMAAPQNAAYINFNLNFGMPPPALLPALPRPARAPVVAAGRQRRGRRR